MDQQQQPLSLAERLDRLSRQLAADPRGHADHDTLTSQIDQLERAVNSSSGSSSNSAATVSQPTSPAAASTPASTSASAAASAATAPPKPVSRSQSDQGGALLGGGTPPILRSRFSHLLDDRPVTRDSDTLTEEHRYTEYRRPRSQSGRVVAELTKLNEDLLVVVGNLEARQEESMHIHSLLIQRAEMAAQRIKFLQDRISYLEGELENNDDELQHLRICLKAVEVQLPPHPDPDIQRCITTFKEDFKALRRKRNSSVNSLASSNGNASASSYNNNHHHHRSSASTASHFTGFTASPSR